MLLAGRKEQQQLGSGSRAARQHRASLSCSFAVLRATSSAGSSDLQLIGVKLGMLTGQVSGMVFLNYVEMSFVRFSEGYPVSLLLGRLCIAPVP